MKLISKEILSTFWIFSRSSQESHDSMLRQSSRRRQVTERMDQYMRKRTPSASPVKSNASPSPAKGSRVTRYLKKYIFPKDVTLIQI